MDSSIVVIIVMCVVAFGLLVWLEVNSRRKKRGEAGRESPGPAEATGETAEGG
ncbi:MAG TPA: hypothetical protein VN228_10915 [Pyrinomonadaceae bacterium]|nr:hypothetical protein [Pyrinomonadaceae bacterium]